MDDQTILFTKKSRQYNVGEYATFPGPTAEEFIKKGIAVASTYPPNVAPPVAEEATSGTPARRGRSEA